jgi:hypothetical protein
MKLRLAKKLARNHAVFGWRPSKVRQKRRLAHAMHFWYWERFAAKGQVTTEAGGWELGLVPEEKPVKKGRA